MCIMTEYNMRSENMSAEIRLLIAALKMSQILSCGSKRPGGLPSKLASCCVMLCDHLTQCVEIVPFASCCVFTPSVMLSGVVLSRSASYYAVVREHTLVRNV